MKARTKKQTNKQTKRIKLFKLRKQIGMKAIN